MAAIVAYKALRSGFRAAKEATSKVDLEKWTKLIETAATNGWDISVALANDQTLTPEQAKILLKVCAVLEEVDRLLKQAGNNLLKKALDPRQQGRLVGMIAYELVSDALVAWLIVGTGGTATPVAAPKAVALTKRLDKFSDVAQPIVKGLEKGEELRKRLDDLGDTLTRMILQQTCFVAGTPLLTPDGEKPIEQFQVGDPILARPENDPHAPVRIQQVDAIFKLEATVIELRVGGQLIETTAEHPFFVAGQGWVRAKDLQPGDPLLGHDERVTLVTSISQTDRVRTVYNLRVTEDQTYFVGRRAWGFSIWVHNTYSWRPAKTGKGFEVINDATGAVVKKVDTLEEALQLQRKFNFGMNGVQTKSKQVFDHDGIQIHFENPNPGQRAGQIHVHVGDEKFFYDPIDGVFRDHLGRTLSQSAQRIVDSKRAQTAIKKALRMLGEQ